MLAKALITLLLLGVSVGFAYYVYPTHPILVWVLLGICWICYRLGLRAQNLFSSRREPQDPHTELKL